MTFGTWTSRRPPGKLRTGSCRAPIRPLSRRQAPGPAGPLFRTTTPCSSGECRPRSTRHRVHGSAGFDNSRKPLHQWVTIHALPPRRGRCSTRTPRPSHCGTPFKRPENGLFRPGTSFRGLLRRHRRHERPRPPQCVRRLGRRAPPVEPDRERRTLRLFYAGDQAHSGSLTTPHG